MRTAIILLFLLAAGSAVGSLFPQRAISARAVAEWQDKYPGWTPVAEFFELFDVYGSWWFTPIYLLLLVSLVGCLTRRYQVQIRHLRRDPHATGDLERQERYVRARTSRPAEEVVQRARVVLQRKRFKVVDIPKGLAAERGHIRESGSLLFHTSILVILLGVALGRMFGASGQVLVVEGTTFTDTRTEYDTITPGRFFGHRHTGFQLHLDDFDVEWFPSGIAKHFESTVTLTDADGEVVVEDHIISVNAPLRYEGRRIYQIAWGWAPVIRIEQEGRVLYDGPTVFLPDGDSWTGVAKIPGTKPQQLGLAMQLFVDPVEGPDGELRDRNRQPRDPVLLSQILFGDLGLDSPQNVYALDPEGLTRVGDSVVGIGRTDDLPNGITLTFSDMVQYSVFQIGYNPGAWLLFGGAIAMLVGLIPGLYGFRRRVWVRVSEDGSTTILELAGHAFQRKQIASEEFEAVVAEIDHAIGQELPREVKQS
jgi:cytochrome c biogenesis protein